MKKDVTTLDQNAVMVISTMNMGGVEVAALSMGAKVKFGFPGNCCHVFNKETGIILEA